MKNIIISLFAALTLLLPVSMNAQTGSWEIFPAFATPQKMIDTPEYVYVLSSNSLISLDKQTNEIASLNTTNRLSSNQVSNIWYSPKDELLFVVHTNGMIDLLYDDGRSFNIADLTNTSVNYGSINDVDFRDGKAYLAVTKGIMVIDMEGGLFEHVGLFLREGLGYARIAVTDSKVITAFDLNGRICVADRNGNLSTNIFTITNNFIHRKSSSDVGEIYGLDGDKFLAVGTAAGNLDVAVTTINPSATGADVVSNPEKLGITCLASRLQPAKNGFVGNNSSDIFYVNRTGELTKQEKFSIPSFSDASMILTNRDDSKSGSFWFVSPAGIGLRNLDGSFAIEQIYPNATASIMIGNIVDSPDGTIYTSTPGLTFGTSYAYGLPIHINQYKNNRMSPLPFNGKSTYTIAINPLNPDEMVIGSFTGLYRYNIATNKFTLYNSSNSTLTPSGGAYMVSDICFDSKGNLYMIQNVAYATDTPHVTMVTADGWNNGAPLSAWSTVGLQQFSTQHSSRIIYTPNGYIVASGGHQIALINMNGEQNLNSVRPLIIDLKSDTDGMTIAGYVKPSLHYNPANSRLWIGTDLGVLYFDEIDKITNSDVLPSRPKISRNDGTNLADFLLDNIFINAITSDSNGNVLIGTNGSGLYRVTPDGTEILEHLSTDDSDIPADNVMAIYADPNSNKIYIGTDRGMAVYYSNSTPARPDFSDVYAYPNPVTPDYTGYITITGLMADSLVKITDSAGRVVHEAKSNGGSVVWDGCDASGSRVKSGVYFVYASASGSGSSKAAVTKIVVVN